MSDSAGSKHPRCSVPKAGVLVGFGTMGRTHQQRFARLGVTIAGVVDPDPAAQAAAAALDLPVTDRLTPAMAAGADFIDLCTPTHLHHQQIREAIDLGLAIFVEKPVVRTRAEVADLRSYQGPALIFVGEVEHYNPALAPFLEDGSPLSSLEIDREVDLGFFLRDARPWFLDEQQSGGLVLDLMIHDLSLIVGKFGRPSVRSARGWSRRFAVMDEVEALLDFPTFTARVRGTWTRAPGATPIVTRIRWRPRGGDRRELLCDRYAIARPAAEEDAFLIEIRRFLLTLETGVVPYSQAIYLDAIEVALDIIDVLKKATHGVR